MEKIEFVAPMDIEKRSMQIIGEELNRRGIHLDPEEDPVVRRAIHTSADFDYAENLVFSEQAVSRLREALAAGAGYVVVSDIPVLREVYGEAVVYIDPKGTWQVPEGIPETSGRAAVLQKYSWRESAKQLFRLCERENGKS